MKNDLQIAAQLFTVRAFTQDEKGIAATLAKVKSIGYDCVQVSAFGPCRPEFLRDELEQNGLIACATHTPYERIIGDTDAVIAEHTILGIRNIGLGWRCYKTKAEAEQFLADILPAARKIRDAGLQFVYHNHQWEFLRMENGQTVMDYYLENTSPSEFGLLPDMYWLQFAGISPQKFLRENADRISVIHLKDMRIAAEDGTPRFAPVFEGNMDYVSICEAASAVGVRVAAVEQDDCYGEDPFEALRRSREHIRERLGL